MRILTVNTLPTGGAASAARQLHEALIRFGHEGELYTLTPPTNSSMHHLGASSNFANPAFWTQCLFENWAQLTSAEKQQQGACELFSDTSCALFSVDAFAKAAEQADIIHLHWMPGVWVSPAFFRQLVGKKIVWTLHDMNPFTGGCHYHATCTRFVDGCGACPLLEGQNNDLSRYVFSLKQRLYPLLDVAFVCPSQWLADVAAQSPLLRNRLLRAIPNAHDLTGFAPRPMTALRAQHDIDETQFVVLAGVDDLSNPRKNLAMLGKALQQLAARAPELPLLLVQFGYGQNLETPWETRHLGQVSHEQLAELYALADVFVHPSRLDNLPNTLCEAQCCGTPVLAFDVGGTGETFVPGESGLLLSEMTPEALADALHSLCTNKEQIAAMRPKARSFAEQRFAPETVAKLYTQLYEEHAQNTWLVATPLTAMNVLWDNLADFFTNLYRQERQHRERLEAYCKHLEGHLMQSEKRIGQLEDTLRESDARGYALVAELSPVLRLLCFLHKCLRRGKPRG